MRFRDKLSQIERIDSLIRRKGTGSPKQLARKLDISERAVYDSIELMKSMDAPIYYDRFTESYCYESPVIFSFGFNKSNRGTYEIFGGKALSFWRKVTFI